MDNKNKILKKPNFPPKIAFGDALFLPLVKAKNQLQNLKKKTKNMRNKTFKCSKLLLFFIIIEVDMVKNVKTVQNR